MPVGDGHKVDPSLLGGQFSSRSAVHPDAVERQPRTRDALEQQAQRRAVLCVPRVA